MIQHTMTLPMPIGTAMPSMKSQLKPDTMINYRFASRTGKLRLDKILQLNLNDVIANNNLSPIEALSNNLVYANVDEDTDFQPNTSKLLKTFQYTLEYLYNRQLDLEGVNKTLENDYSQLINDSYAIEERLKTNKLYLAQQSKEKKEKEMLLTSYKAIIDYNTRSTSNDESNKELKELLKNPNEKYYCHLCSGKPFSTGSKLESHMKRRHINQYNQKDPMNESFENYGAKIEEMRKYFETMLKEKEDEQMRQKYLSNLDKMRTENEKRVKEMEGKLKDTLFDFKEFLLKSMKNQPQQQPILLEQPKAVKDNQQDFIKMAQSLNEINALLKSQYDKKMEEMMKEINDLKSRPMPKAQQDPPIKREVKEIREIKHSILSSSMVKEPLKESIVIKPIVKPPIIEEEKPIIIPEEPKKASYKEKEEEKEKEDSYHPPLKKESLKQTILASDLVINQSIEIIPHKRPSEHFDNELLRQPPKVNLNKTVGPQGLKKKFKPIHFVRDLSKTMTVKDQLEEFFAHFSDRDNELFEIEEVKPKDYLKKIMPASVMQKEDDLNATLRKSLINTAKKDNFLYESFEDKNKRELLEIIDQTLKNINNTNIDQEIAELYYSSVQKALDLKLYETEKEELRATMIQNNKSILSKNSLHSKKSKRSRAAEVIKKANEEIEIEF